MPIMKKLYLIVLLLSVILSQPLMAQPGATDTSFTPAWSGTSVSALLLQKNGKLIAGGTSTLNSTPILMRFNPDGSTDMSYSGLPSQGNITALCFEQDSSILAAGTMSIPLTQKYLPFITKFSSSGALDASFKTHFDTTAANINKVAQLSNSQILVAGTFMMYDSVSVEGIVRLNSDGSLDTSFQTNLLPSNGIEDFIILNDSSIIVSGEFGNPSGALLVKLKTDGTVDSISFTMDPQLTSYIGYAPKLLLQKDGSILISGTDSDYVNGYIFKLQPDGTMNTSWFWNPVSNSSGITEIDYLYEDNKGNILAGGLFSNISGSGSTIFNIVRLDSTGNFDSYFATDSIDDNIRSIVQTQDSMAYYVGGNFTTPKNNLMRLSNQDFTMATFYTANTDFPTTICTGDSIEIDYKYSGGTIIPPLARINMLQPAGSNLFIVQLSDSSGNFTNPLNLDTLFSPVLQQGSVKVTVPDSVPGGTKYRIRLYNNNPALRIEDNGINLIVRSPGQVTFNAPNTLCVTHGTINLWNYVSPKTGSFLGDSTFTPVDSVVGSNPLTYTISSQLLACQWNYNDTITVYDTVAVQITPPEVACQRAVLNFSYYPITPVSFSSSGQGTFQKDSLSQGLYNYIPAGSDFTADSLIVYSTTSGPCTAMKDSTIFYLSPGAFATTENDTAVCSDITSLPVLGTVQNGSASWTKSGKGVFSDSTLTQTTYIPDTTDIQNGYVMLYLTAVSQNICSNWTDSFKVTFNNYPVITPPASDTAVCAGSISLKSKVSGADSVKWSGGTGSFSKTDSVATTYTTATGERNGQLIFLTITAEKAGCASVYQDYGVKFVPLPVVNAGNDTTVCESTNNIPLNGSSSTGYGIWSSLGQGTFNPDSSLLQVLYFPGSSDTASGAVTLTLQSNKDSICPAQYDSMTISFKKIPVVFAGADTAVCKGANVNLHGSVSNATGATWSNGAGKYSAPNQVVSVYTPDSTEIQNGSATLFLTSTGSVCPAVKDTLLITFIPDGVANAGTDFNVCLNTPVPLAGSVTNASGGKWSSAGQGNFYPYDTTLNAKYYPSTTEKLSGSILLTLTPTGATCQAIPDTVLVSFTSIPFAYAGINQKYDSSGNVLSGIIKNTTSAAWSTSGTGTFSPSSSDLNATYIPSATDLAKTHVVISLTAGASPTCNGFTSNLLLTSGTPCNILLNKSQSDNTISYAASNANNTAIGTYAWNFGDQQTAFGRIQTHTYTSTGTFVTTVGYATADSSCFATRLDTNTIGNINTALYKISGNVQAGNQNLDYGIMMLFKFDGKHYDWLNTKNISPSNNGNYVFDNLENGYYLVYSIVSDKSQNFNEYIPTYYKGQDTTWQQATFIDINNADFTNANINLVTAKLSSSNSGLSVIKGVIVYDDLVITRTTAATNNPVDDAVVTLYNNSGDRLTSTYTDPFGNYSFDSLGTGNYSIDVQYAGTYMSKQINLTSNGSDTLTGNTSLVLDKATVGTRAPVSSSSVVLYPNPTSTILTIEVPQTATSDFSLSVLNTLGIRVKTSEIAGIAGKIRLPVQDLDSGMYLLEIKSGDEVFYGKFKKL